MKRCPKCKRLNTDTSEYCLCGKYRWVKSDIPNVKYDSDFFWTLKQNQKGNKMINRVIYYNSKKYEPKKLWQLIDVLAGDLWEVNILRLPYCPHFPQEGAACYLAQLTSQRRGGTDCAGWGRNAYEALGNCLSKIHNSTSGNPAKANRDFFRAEE